ncbi:MAG: MoxR family ATPase [Anaerovoracaceae bacterium]|nr:MoxR family ATPase [Anaerovoracaceae bacterium]
MNELDSSRIEGLAYIPITEEQALACSRKMKSIADNMETVIAGKRRVVVLTVLALVAGGHVLIEDVPGTGKTSLVSALAKSISCDYSRIQFTPDVMPSDVTGFSIYNQKTGEFEFRPGAAMSNIVLADEINRASAKTQSAMLEIMEEKQVTVDSNTYVMDRPYMVLATQNPIEQLGTYQLPEAQIDRFMIKFSIGYPSFKDEVRVIMTGERSKKEIGPCITKEEVVELTDECRRVIVSREMSDYIVSLITATRNNEDIRLGSSPRGSIALYQLSRAYALYQGRNYVIPDDIRFLAPYVLGHRVILTHKAKTEKKTGTDVVNEIVKNVVVPSSPLQAEAGAF